MSFERLPTAIDLFAGAGGFGLGLGMAGFDVRLSLEIDRWASDTLRYNNPTAEVIEADIRNFDTEDSIRNAAPFAVDLIVGGPPCQGFSIAGPARKDPADPRNSLFVNFAQWVGVLQPKAFVMENVKGLLGRKNAEGIRVIDIIKDTLALNGYLVELWLLNSAQYGVPQVRERLFVVGHRGAIEIGPPQTSHEFRSRIPQKGQLSLFGEEQQLLEAVHLWDAISDLPELKAGEGAEEQQYNLEPQSDFQRWVRCESNVLYNHAAMRHSRRLVERFEHIGWGESSSDVPEEHRALRRSGNGQFSGKNYDQNNRRLHPDRPSHTIAAAFYANFIHPFQHRNLTAREGARIQSFPDRYRFLGKKTVVSQKLLHREERFDEKFLCQYNQIGNAVPPLLAKAVTNHLRKALDL